MVGQDRFCHVVTGHLKKWDVNVEFSSELLSFQQHEDYVTATVTKTKDGHSEKAEADYVIGADGGKSMSALPLASALVEYNCPSGIVRKLLGLNFEGETGDSELIVIGDIQMTGSIDKGVRRPIFGSPAVN